MTKVSFSSKNRTIDHIYSFKVDLLYYIYISIRTIILYFNMHCKVLFNMNLLQLHLVNTPSISTKYEANKCTNMQIDRPICIIIEYSMNN